MREILLVLVVSVLSTVTQCQKPPSTITYYNCSSVYCVTCISAYMCGQCSYNDQPSCCPKYCTKCLSMKVCVECEPHFVLIGLNSNSIVCTRVYNSTDPNRNQSDIASCINGYYPQNVTSSCMSCNVSNCQTCSSYQTCTQCNSKYFPFNTTTTNSVNQTVYLQVCQPCILNCIKCANPTSCQSCLSGYFSTTLACEPCQTAYCMSCINNGATCQTCITGAFINSTSNQCILCSYTINNCTKCSLVNNIPKCTLCAMGFYLNSSSVCQLCPTNCISCQLVGNFLNCTTCDENYVYDNVSKSCILCGLGCGSCDFVNSTLNNCTNCSNGYAPVWNNETNTFSCSGCQYPCLQCTNDSISLCFQCEIGFYINFVVATNLQIGQCYFCNIQNCISCSSAKQCTQCEDGYFIKFVAESNSYGCSPCPGQCSSCSVANASISSSPQCTLCASGFTLQKNNCAKCKMENCMICSPVFSNQCLQCIDGYMLSETNFTCSPCDMVNCRVCNITYDSTNCIECNATYYLVQSQDQEYYYCLPCGQNCFNCTNQTYCLECVQAFYPVVETNKTVVCRQCPAKCLTCNSIGCLFCADGFYPITQQHTFLNQTTNVSCSPCNTIQGCVSCFNSVFCRECTTQGYSVLPSTTGSCIPCGYGCVTCDNEQACLLCEDGFLLNTQTNQCMDVAGIPAWGIFVILTFGFALIFVCVEKIIRRFMKKKTTEEQDEILLEVPFTQRPFGEVEGRSVSHEISFRDKRVSEL